MASMDITQVLRENTSQEDRERVQKVIKRYEKEVRREVEDLTRLRATYEREDGEKQTLTIKPDLKLGHPTSPDPVTLQAHEALIARLGAWRRHLKAVNDASKALLALNDKEPDLLSQFDYTDPFEEALETVSSIAARLAEEANPEALFKHVRKLAAVGGRASEPKEKAGKGQGYNIEINVYWAMLVYISDVRAIPLENLVIYTLAHEIAHVYVRCGYDASGYPWEEGAYAQTQEALREALADYYALQTLYRLEAALVPELAEVFGLLHEGLPARLRLQDVWVPEYKPELVRHVLIPIRRNGSCTTLAEFEERLEAEKEKFIVKKPKPNLGNDLFDQPET